MEFDTIQLKVPFFILKNENAMIFYIRY